jgi:hypothetical protein
MIHDYWLRENGSIGCGHRSSIAGKTPMELMMMAETRRMLVSLLRHKRTDPALKKAIETARRSLRSRLAPLTPVGIHQRMGWLDEMTHITCAREMDGFTLGKEYTINSRNVKIGTLTERIVSGRPEEILVSGQEMFVTLLDDSLRRHLFAHHAPPPDPRIHAIHPLMRLAAHFAVPQVHDITAIYPTRYMQLKAILSSL